MLIKLNHPEFVLHLAMYKVFPGKEGMIGTVYPYFGPYPLEIV